MERITEKQMNALYKSLVRFMLSHWESELSPIELFNLWATENKRHITDPDWVAHIVDWMSDYRTFPKEYQLILAKEDRFI